MTKVVNCVQQCSMVWHGRKGEVMVWSKEKCKNPGDGKRPRPKSTQIFWKISRLVPISFFGTKFFRDQFRDFLRYQIILRPFPILFSVPIFFNTGSDTFFGTKYFWFRFRYHQKNWRIPGTGMSHFGRYRAARAAINMEEKDQCLFTQTSSLNVYFLSIFLFTATSFFRDRST